MGRGRRAVETGRLEKNRQGGIMVLKEDEMKGGD
jgi:hypothetical protein